MVLRLGGQDLLFQIIGGAKHTILPLFAPFCLIFLNYWGGQLPPLPPHNYLTGRDEVFSNQCAPQKMSVAQLVLFFENHELRSQKL